MSELRKCIFTLGNNVPVKRGFFHLWGSCCDTATGNDVCQRTTAIVEDEDGLVYELGPSDIEFSEWSAQ